MATKTISGCSGCGYPLTAEYEGQTITCPMCSSINEVIAQDGVTVPTWLLASTIGLAIGIIAGPAIISSTEEGARWLEKKARERIARG